MNILSKKRQSIFGNKKIMVKSGRFHVHQWCLIFFLTMKVKMRREAPSSKCPRQCDTAECFFLTSFFFREVTAVWLLPLDPAAIRSLTAKSGPSPITVWYQWILWLSIHSVLVLLGSIAKDRLPWDVLSQSWNLHGSSTAKLFEHIFTSEHPVAHLPSGTDLTKQNLIELDHLTVGWLGWVTRTQLHM